MSNFDDIFESTPQTDEFDKEAWAAKKKAERDEVYALADATAEAVCADGGKFRDYLDVQAAFRNYSATNALLILATKPDARRLGDKDFWRDQGVYIKRQEFGRPIKIVESNGEYTRDDGSIGVSYNIKRVYDISQTTARTRTPQAVSHDARALLNALIYKRPAPVQSVDELPNGMDAVYDREQNAVFVRRGLSANDLFCGLSKALAQAELARTGEEYTEENAGFKAQCVSYILGKEFGIDVSGYMRSWRCSRLLPMRDRSGEQIKENPEEMEALIGLIAKQVNIDKEAARFFYLEMWAYTHGIASMIATGFYEWDEQLASRALTDVYEGLKHRYKNGGVRND